MEELTRYPVQIRRCLNDLVMSFRHTTERQINDLMEMGFSLNLKMGFIILDYNEDAIAQLIATEIPYLEQTVQHYREYTGMADPVLHHYIIHYIEPLKSVHQVLDEIRADWVLDGNQYKAYRTKQKSLSVN